MWKPSKAYLDGFIDSTTKYRDYCWYLMSFNIALLIISIVTFDIASIVASLGLLTGTFLYYLISFVKDYYK